mmetsp:Transcript_59951/g.90378  ORF Transcript_59951/g.90378 Transcript_59951/m.90378 type:complete len:202 (+) Transcript_59951:166-771(+)
MSVDFRGCSNAFAVAIGLLLLPAILLNNHPLNTATAISVDDRNCVGEFDKCVIQRDCCEGLNCVTGDWQYTTDSTCLSPKSEGIVASKFSFEEKVSLVNRFYEKMAVAKTADEVEKIVHKYKRDFPNLIVKLERKYDANFDIVDAVVAGGDAKSTKSYESFMQGSIWQNISSSSAVSIIREDEPIRRTARYRWETLTRFMG